MLGQVCGARPRRERGARGGDCLRERSDEAVDAVLAFCTGGQHAGLESQRRVFCRPLVLRGVRPIGLLHGLQLLRHLWHLRAVGALDRPWLGWNLGHGRLGVLANFCGVWKVGSEASGNCVSVRRGTPTACLESSCLVAPRAQPPPQSPTSRPTEAPRR